MFTILNVLAVTRTASYISTQVNGPTAAHARYEAQRVVRGWLERDSYAIDASSPVFIYDATRRGENPMEQTTAGALAAEEE